VRCARGASPDRLLKGAEIARESKAPPRFLSKILGEMRSAGLIVSRRGYRGGSVLVRDPRDITVAELTLATSGYELFAPLPCERFEPRLAFVDDLQRRLRDVAAERLAATSIAQIAAQIPA
jgi:DNA-binding IscR family transcriptional regulator